MEMEKKEMFAQKISYLRYCCMLKGTNMQHSGDMGQNTIRN